MGRPVDPNDTNRSTGTEDPHEDPWYSEHEYDPYREYFHEVERIRESKKARRLASWAKLFGPIRDILFSIAGLLRIFRR